MLLNLHTGSLIHIDYLSITYKLHTLYTMVFKIDNLKAAASQFEFLKEPRTYSYNNISLHMLKLWL